MPVAQHFLLPRAAAARRMAGAREVPVWDEACSQAFQERASKHWDPCTHSASGPPGPQDHPKARGWAQGEPPWLRRDGAGQERLQSSHGSSRTQRTAGDAATPGGCTSGCRGSAGTPGQGLAVTTVPSICSTFWSLCSLPGHLGALVARQPCSRASEQWNG